MAERYWSGTNLVMKTRGDKEKARKLEKTARIKVGYLFDRLLPGQNYSIQKWTLADGSKIQVQVMRGPLGDRAFARVWAAGEEEPILLMTYYLESSFMIPSQELNASFVTADNKTVQDIRDAIFVHNERSRTWSSWDPKEIGFIPRPTGGELVARIQPLCLGYDAVKEDLIYAEAFLRWRKTYIYFGAFDVYPENLMQGRGSGTSTGKMVLYQRAKLGKSLTLWRDENGEYDDYVLNDWSPSHSCIGLLTDEFGDYWKVSINESATATFVKLYLWPEFRKARDEASNEAQVLFIEGYCLAFAQLTQIEYEVNISGVPALTEAPYGKWMPMAYSWHFNWDGSAAAIVVHRGVGREETRLSVIGDVETQIWTLDIGVTRSGGAYYHTVTCAVSQTYQWSMIPETQSDNFWIPGLTFGTKIMGAVVINQGLPRVNYPSANEIPLYGWYIANESSHRNMTWQTVNYTRERNVLEESFSPSEELFGLTFWVCGNSVQTGGGSRRAGISQQITYSFGDITLSEISESSAYDVASINFSYTDMYVVKTGVVGSALSFADNSGGYPCPSTTYTIVANPGDYNVGADKYIHYWTFTSITSLANLSDGIPAITLTIPHDCAEGAMIASRWQAQHTTRTSTYIENSATPSIMYIEYTNFKSLPSEDPPVGIPSSVYTGYTGGDPESFVTEYDTQHIAKLRCHVFGRNPARASYSESLTITQPDVITNEDAASAIESWGYGAAASEQGTLQPFSIFESFGGEMMVRGVEDHFVNGFPEAFGDEQYPPVIVGSI